MGDVAVAAIVGSADCSSAVELAYSVGVWQRGVGRDRHGEFYGRRIAEKAERMPVGSRTRVFEVARKSRMKGADLVRRRIRAVFFANTHVIGGGQ